jgi:hypothetical protein
MAESQAPDDFTLPLGDIPFGWTFAGLDNRYWAAGSDPDFVWAARLIPNADNPVIDPIRGSGPTPRAALLTAIAKIAA